MCVCVCAGAYVSKATGDELYFSTKDVKPGYRGCLDVLIKKIYLPGIESYVDISRFIDML